MADEAVQIALLAAHAAGSARPSEHGVPPAL
jgi:hypothetical protein